MWWLIIEANSTFGYMPLTMQSTKRRYLTDGKFLYISI